MNRLSQDDTSHLNYETRLTVRDAEGRSFKQNRTCTQRQEEQQQERQQEQQQHPQHSSPAIRNESILSSNLRAKLQGDVLVASGITFAFAPFIATIDKAIVQRAAGSHSVVQSSRESLRGMVRHPVAYVKSPAFLMVWGVYAMTYSAVNCLKTCAEHRDVFDGERRAGRFCRDGGDGAGLNLNNFVMTAAVNSSLQLMKDRYYASNFGIWNSTNKIPLRSYGMWALRDCTIIGSSFILPDILGKLLQEKMELDRATASRISQFTCPIAAQAVRISQSYHPNIKQSYQAQPYCIPFTTFTNSIHTHTSFYPHKSPPYIPNDRWRPLCNFSASTFTTAPCQIYRTETRLWNGCGFNALVSPPSSVREY